ncbi:apoptotic protease-activating factor 1 [Anabrus simplex]|uniref:apoptotic protease-activating factor 1 n=1 Tax=Anabrus simplex TaxID=316456 RepID=UPI0035A38672
MDTLKRLTLQKLREKIVADLDVVNVLDYLISKEILDDQNKDLILSERSRRDRARRLLDILPTKGPLAFECFVESLKEPYSWLYDSLMEGDGEMQNDDHEGKYSDALLLGGLPRPPPYNIEREEKLAELRQSLKGLKRGNYVVLHGMTGAGKSCLASAAVYNKELLVDTFKRSVFWLSVGDASLDDILSHMVQLWQKLQPRISLQSDSIEIEKNLTSVEGAKNALILCFLHEALREGLLILDDVTSPKLIEAFDVGCKILVTTKDLDVMKNVRGREKLIKVNEGFTEKESLSLLSKCTHIAVEKLPPQAVKIHKLCKGVPMIIALIGGQMEDNLSDVQKNYGRWDYYTKMLSRKDYKSIKRNSLSQEDGLFQTIGMSVDSLPEDLKEYYKDFAVFVEDVNITSEVLQTLWSLQTRYEVEDIMSSFLKKSLAVSKWNEEIYSSVYGVHDLLLYYLKHRLTDEEKTDRHRKLLDKYRAVCGGNYAKLPNDNYIFYYIGYHLYEAKWLPMFKKLFLDLEFIGAKLKVTGPGDILVDFRKYRDHIINGDNRIVPVVEDLENFIKVFGLDLYKYKDLDIVQCGLQERKNSCVYEMALQIAKANPKKLYLEFILDQEMTSHAQTVPLREEVFAACFTADKNKILIASGSGLIYLWKLDYARMVYIFSGHSQRVVHLELSPDEVNFLSCSLDGTVKLWTLEGLEYRSGHLDEYDELGHPMNIPSPRLTQSHWSNVFSDDPVNDKSLMTFSHHTSHVHKARFSDSGEEIISCSKDGSVKIWNCQTGDVRLNIQVPNPGTFATCGTFACHDALFVIGVESSLSVYNSETGDIVRSLQHTGSIICVLSVPDSENLLIVVTSESITVWKWGTSLKSKSTVNGDIHENAVELISANNISFHTMGERKSAIYVCATVSLDGQYVVAAASDHSISIWDIENNKMVVEYKDHSGLVRCLDTFWTEEYQLLLSGSDDRTLKIWRLDQSEAEQQINLLASFDTTWDSKSLETMLPLLAAPDSSNKLKVLRGTKIVAETPVEPSKITMCSLSSSGLLAVYGCEDGTVKQFNVTTKSRSTIMKLSQAVEYLQILQNRDLVLIAAGDYASLKLWRENGQQVLVCGGQTCCVVRSFLLPLDNKLLSCSMDASVKLWDTASGKLTQVVAGRVDKAYITSADMNANRDLLVLGDAESCFHMASLQVTSDSPFVTLSSLRTFKIPEESIWSCQIAPDPRLLALGLDSGAIMLWDLENSKEISKLKLHKSRVRHLQFAHLVTGRHVLNSTLPLLLVSVGEQIGWWDVGGLLAVARRKQRRSGSRRRGSSSPLPQTNSFLPVNMDNEVDFRKELSEVWFNKEGREEKKELLGCIKLLGTHAQSISTSPDFTAFATIDASGVVYLMKVLE